MSIDRRQLRHERAQIRVLRYAHKMHEAQLEAIDTHPTHTTVDRNDMAAHVRRLIARNRRELERLTTSYAAAYGLPARVRHVLRAMRRHLARTD